MRVDAVIGRGDVVLPYRRADGSVRWEFRPASEVTDQASLDSFEALPVTNEHPPVHLDASNVKAYKVGQCGTPRADGALVRAKVVLDDRAAMADVRAGKRQISPGYRVVLDETPGVWNGQHYDARQTKIRGNHVAIVPLGRQGPEVALRMDSADAVLAYDLLMERHDMADPKTEPKNDGAPKTDPKADAFAELKADIASMIKPIADSVAKVDALAKRVDEMGAMMEAMAGEKPDEDELPKVDKADGADKEGQRLDAATRARIDALEAQVKRSDDERKALDAKHRADMAEAEARSDVLATAKRILGDDYTGAGKSRFDVMTDVVLKIDGAESKGNIDRERANVRADSPDSEREFRGYVRARYEGALKTWAAKADTAEALLAAAKQTQHGDAGDREDKAAQAKADADERRRNKWREGHRAK
jgi:hypothetical protein